MNRLSLFIFPVLSLALGIVSCARDPEIFDDHVNIALKEPLESLDPLYAVDESSGIVLSLLYSRLYKTDLKGKLRGDLVKSETISGHSAVVTLRGADYKDKYGDYTITAEDVKKCLTRLMDANRQVWLTRNIKSIRVLSRYTILFELTGGSKVAQLWKTQKSLFTLPQTSIYDYSFYEERNEFRSPSFFTLFEHTPNRIVLRGSKNKNVVFHIIHDDSSRWFYFKRGLLDYYDARGVFRYGAYDKEKYTMEVRPQLTVLYGAIVAGPDKKGPLADVSFRKALNYRIDRINLTQKILLGAYEAADYPVPDILAGKLPIVYTYKPDYPTPKMESAPIMIYTPSDRERQLTARYIASTVRGMGYASQIKVVDLPTLIRLNNSGLPGIYLFKWLADYPHAENFLIPLFYGKNQGAGGNRAYFENERLDAIIESGLNDPNNIEKAQKIIQQNAPWVFVGFSRQFIFVNTKKNIKAPVIYTGWSSDAFGWR